MKPVRSFNATTIGKCANKTLITGRSGQIVGCISRGIFVMAASRWVLFFTGEVWHKLLTINFDSQIDSTGQQVGDFAKGWPPQVKPLKCH